MDVNFTELFERIHNESDPLQKARLIFYLRKNHSLSLSQVAKGLKIQAAQVAHILRLLKLPPIVIDGYYSKLVTITHLFIIARLSNSQDMVDAYEYVLTNNASVQLTEEYVRKKLYNIDTKEERLSEDEINTFINSLKLIEPQLTIAIIQTRIKGKICIELKGDTLKTTEIFRKLFEQWSGELPFIETKEKLRTLD